MFNQILQKRREQNLLTYLFFLRHEEAYSNLYRHKVCKTLKEDKIRPNLTEAIRILYKNAVIRIKYRNEPISTSITTYQGVTQGCRLSQTLFIIYTNKVKKWKENVSMTKRIPLKMKIQSKEVLKQMTRHLQLNQEINFRLQHIDCVILPRNVT